MITIQTTSIEILNDHPRKFYFMFGQEFGIKDKYLEHLKRLYVNVVEFDEISKLAAMLASKRLFNLPDTLYIVRDDLQYIKSLDSKVSEELLSLSFDGCAVFLYSSDSYLDKVDKYFKDNCVYIDAIDAKYIKKYLSDEFSTLSDSVISKIAKIANNYGQSRLFCTSLKYLDDSIFADYTEDNILSHIGLQNNYKEDTIRQSILFRNYVYLQKLLHSSTIAVADVFYLIFNICLELEKLLTSKTTSTDLEFLKLWSLEDVYNLFNQTYRALLLNRSSAISEDTLLDYVCLLLAFKHIPSLENTYGF